MSAETAHSYARKVCGYITNDNDVVKHVKRMWGIEFAQKDIARIRRDIPGQQAPRPSVTDALSIAPPLSTNSNGFDPLAAALHRYHSKNAPTADARKHWAGLVQ